MQLFGDYHTHTIYSQHNHGKGTILQNALMAKEKGLKEIAISDHGFSHKLYGVNRDLLPKIREEIEEAKNLTGVNIYLGIEENLLSLDGKIGILPEDLKYLDIITVGYHKMAKPATVKDKFGLFLPNNLAIFKPSKQRIQKNTLAYLKMLETNNINIISHLGVGCPVDVKEVGKFAKQNNVFIELNGKRIAFTDQDITDLVEQETMFLINSDAHSPERVGEVSKPMAFAIKHQIPIELIANVDKLPVFKSIK